jgi:hypothetical protein
VASIFTRTSQPSDDDAAFHWLQTMLGPKRTCLHCVRLTPRAASKVALFDLDGSLIRAGSRATVRGVAGGKSASQKLKEVHDVRCVCQSAVLSVSCLMLVHSALHLDGK